MNFFAFDLTQLPYVIVVLLIAFTVHEFSHAYVAYKFGDPTAKNQGRVTLNPMQHLDPVGTIMILLFGFGWARPVPVNRYNFKHPRLAGVLVSFAGPFSNLLVVILGYVIYYGLKAALIEIPFYIEPFFDMLFQLNLVLFLFNLLPVPPLDGYRIIEDIVSPHLRAKMTQYEQYGMLIFLIIVLTPLNNFAIQPLFYKVLPSISYALSKFVASFYF